MDPCHQEGVSDGKGNQVCGTKAGGGCSNNGDRCDTQADCCDTTSLCINKVCSEAPPPK